jgi:hypothetical protein
VHLNDGDKKSERSPQRGCHEFNFITAYGHLCPGAFFWKISKTMSLTDSEGPAQKQLLLFFVRVSNFSVSACCGTGAG